MKKRLNYSIVGDTIGLRCPLVVQRSGFKVQGLSNFELGTLNCIIGGGERVRTDDPLRARQVLSQLSYTPNETLARMEMVGLAGLEPLTSRLSVVCSTAS